MLAFQTLMQNSLNALYVVEAITHSMQPPTNALMLTSVVPNSMISSTLMKPAASLFCQNSNATTTNMQTQPEVCHPTPLTTKQTTAPSRHVSNKPSVPLSDHTPTPPSLPTTTTTAIAQTNHHASTSPTIRPKDRPHTLLPPVLDTNLHNHDHTPLIHATNVNPSVTLPTTIPTHADQHLRVLHTPTLRLLLDLPATTLPTLFATTADALATTHANAQILRGLQISFAAPVHQPTTKMHLPETNSVLSMPQNQLVHLPSAQSFTIKLSVLLLWTLLTSTLPL
jgi:hypothetical protein